MKTTVPKKLFCFKPSSGSGGNDHKGFETHGHQEIQIRPGLWMSMINFSAARPICLDYEKQYPVIDFGFILSGNIRRKPGPEDPWDGMRVKTGITGARLENRQSGTFAIPADTPQQMLHLHMTQPFFREVVSQEYKVLPPPMQAVLTGTSQPEFISMKPMIPDIQAVVYQLLNTSSNAFPWSLYLEGKSLELLSLHLAALGLDHQKSDKIVLNHGEKKQVLQAKALLVRDLQDPPSLSRLAAMAGLSVAKLQAGFRQTFGKSVFDYFREYRMQEAKILMEKTETNVSQTAWQVGYVNVSHFSAAFKKRFGILPKHYLKNRLTGRESNPVPHTGSG